MRRWKLWCFPNAAAATFVRLHHQTNAGRTERVEKYHLPLRRALHLIERRVALGPPLRKREENNNNNNVASCEKKETAALRQAAARYAAYHCHHMLTSFRLERKKWTNSAELLSFDDLTRVMEFLFFAALLLHLTALYETADKYCEALIDVTMSCTCFLSKSVDRLHEADRTLLLHHQRNEGSGEDTSSSLLGSEKQEQQQEQEEEQYDIVKHDPWNSLHWAVVHFSYGVVAWGLLDHTEALFDMKRTMGPYNGILGTFTHIVRDILAEKSNLSSEDVAFLFHAGSKEGSANWFIREHSVPVLPSANNNDDTDRRTDAEENDIEGDLLFTQQRRLQLLPLVWLALLSRHCTLLKGPCCFISVRHALLRALPLFKKGTNTHNSALKLIIQCCYFPSSSFMKASAVEMGVLLAHLERCGDVPSSMPVAATHVELLQGWMRTDAAVEVAPDANTVQHAYMAFRNIPRCALQMVMGTNDGFATCDDGEAFVQELLFHASAQWSFHVLNKSFYKGEMEDLLLSAQYVVSLFDLIQHNERNQKSSGDGTAVLVIETILRGFAVRVAGICKRSNLIRGKRLSDLMKFDALLDRVLRKGESRYVGDYVPKVYEKNKHLWIRNV